MIVVFIAGILAVVLLPTLATYQDEEKLLAASAELADTLRFAASEARKTKIPLRLELNPGSESYQLKVHASGDLLFHPLDKKSFVTSFTSPSPYSGVNLATVNGSSANSTIIFNIRGTVAADTTIILEYGGQSRSIIIHSATGRVTVN